MSHQQSNPQNTDQLVQQLRQSLCPTNDGTPFLPLDALDGILAGRDNLAALQLCKRCSDDERLTPERIHKFVWANGVASSSTRRAPGSKILAILLLIEKPQMICRFAVENITDDGLPFQFTPQDGSWNVRTRQGQPIELFNKWKYLDIGNFSKYQWSVLSPFFQKPDDNNPDKVYHYDLQNDMILPFKKSEEDSLDKLDKAAARRGSYGAVFKVQIHAAHCDFDVSVSPDLVFGVKRLERTDETAFNNEVDTLKRFSVHTNDHLIQLLATYKWRNNYYMIFPWADKNLQGLWEAIDKPQNCLNLSLWMARQCHGLAVGLSHIHVYQIRPQNETGVCTLGLQSQEKPYGRHNDIKHENVLWFKDNSNDAAEYSGQLKISDFGFVKFSSEGSRSIVPTHNVYTPTYRPPECALPDHPISRSSDLWSLGCLYLEFVTWVLKGYAAATDEFIDRRLAGTAVDELSEDTFFIIRNHIVSLKDSVVAHIESLHSEPHCTAYLHDFLDCIANQLLLPDPAKRIKCDDLVHELDRILEKCQRDQQYCTKGEPRSNDRILQRSYDLRSSKNTTDSLPKDPAGPIEFPSGHQPEAASGATVTQDGITRQTTADLNRDGHADELSDGTTAPSDDDIAAPSLTIQAGSGDSHDAIPKTSTNHGQTNSSSCGDNIELPEMQNGNDTERTDTGTLGLQVDLPRAGRLPGETRSRGFWRWICCPSSWGILCIGRRGAASSTAIH